MCDQSPGVCVSDKVRIFTLFDSIETMPWIIPYVVGVCQQGVELLSKML